MLSFVVGLGALSCSSSSAPSPPPATFSDIYPLIFPRETKAQCTFCHGLPANDKSNGTLSVGMDQASAYSALVGKTSMSSHCSGKTYVVPGDPDNSLMYQKVTSPPCGEHMPLGGDPLTSEQIGQIRSWIAAGAKDD